MEYESIAVDYDPFKDDIVEPAEESRTAGTDSIISIPVDYDPFSDEQPTPEAERVGIKEPKSTVLGTVKALGTGLAKGVTTELPAMVGGATEFAGRQLESESGKKALATVAMTGGPEGGFGMSPYLTQLMKKPGAEQGISRSDPEYDAIVSAITNIGKDLKDWARETGDKIYGPEKKKEEVGTIENIVYEGSKMIGPSVLPGAVVAKGIKVLRGVGGLVKAAKVADAAGDAAKATELMMQATKIAQRANKIASGTVALLFGGSQAQQTIDTANQRIGILEKQGKIEEAEKVKKVAEGLAPYATGAIETAGEYFGTKYLGKLLRLDEAGIAKRGIKNTVFDFLKTLGVEVGTEIGQAAGESGVEKVSGIRPDADPLQEALDVIGPTTFMTLLTGGTGVAINKIAGHDDKDLLSNDPNGITVDEIKNALNQVQQEEVKQPEIEPEIIEQPISSTAEESARTLMGEDVVEKELDQQRIKRAGIILPEEAGISAEESAKTFEQAQADQIKKDYEKRPVRYGIVEDRVGKAAKKRQAEIDRISEQEADEKTVIELEANEAATSPKNDLKGPTEDQKAYGNYKKGHIKGDLLNLAGMQITIENPQGSIRTEKKPDNAPPGWKPSWSTEVKGGHYGYFVGTKGADLNDKTKKPDSIDVIVVGPDTGKAYIIDQINPDTGEFDEHKTIIGAKNKIGARKAYLSNYEKGWKGLGEITEMPTDEFKAWIGDGTRKTEPVAYKQKEVSDQATRGSEAIKAPQSQSDESAIITPSKLKESKVSTLGGEIRKMGKIDWGNFKGELRQTPRAVRMLSQKGGMPIDLAEQQLKDDGWLAPDEDLKELLRSDPLALRRNKVIGEGGKKLDIHKTESEKRIEEEMEWEPEAPPKGDYVQISAQDLPEGKKLTLLENKSTRGWDVYEVIEKDPFGVTLKDGITVELRPGDKVEVRKDDLPKIPKEQSELIKVKPKIFDTQPSINEPAKQKRERKEKGTSHLEQQDMFGYNQKGLFGKSDLPSAETVTEPSEKAVSEKVEPKVNHKTERFVWRANKEGGQKKGNIQENIPITEEIFDSHIKARVRQNSLDEWLRDNPNDTHIERIVRGDGVELYNKTGSLKDLNPKNKWAKQVNSFTDKKAVEWRSVPDSKIVEKATPPTPEKANKPTEKAKEPWEMTKEEFLSKNMLKPAIRLPNKPDDLIIGKRGQTHLDIKFDVEDRSGIKANAMWESGWVLPNGEWVNHNEAIKFQKNKDSKKIVEELTKEQEIAIRNALSENKPVPESVLAEYPDLKPTKPEATESTISKEAVQPGEPQKEVTGKPETPKIDRKQQVGQAWVNNQIKPILATREIKRGKYKGMVEVTLTRGRNPDGTIRPGRKRKIKPEKIKEWPGEGGQTSEQFSITPGDSGITLKDVQQIFKGQNVGISDDGSIWVKTIGGDGLKIKKVSEISPNEIAFELFYGRMREEGELLSGKFQNGTIELQKDIADKWTLAHESEHFMESVGIINNREQQILKHHIENLVKNGKFSPQDKNNIGGQEDRAQYIADELKARSKTTDPVKRVLDKIFDFIDQLINLFKRTSRGIVRDIESGRIFERRGEIKTKPISGFQKTADRWHSKMYSVISEKLANNGGVKSFIDTIKSWAKKGIIKQEELDWSGLEEWLNSKSGRISKQEILDYLAENNVQVFEVEKGKGQDDADIDQWLNNADAEVRETEDGFIASYAGTDIQEIYYSEEDAWEALREEAEDQIEQYQIDEPNKFSQYQMEGEKSDYRELLLTLPDRMSSYDVINTDNGEVVQSFKNRRDAGAYILKNAGNFRIKDVEKDTAYRSTHFDEPNILAHVRFNTRMVDGKKVLFIEEIQSDWAQEGRKKGFKTAQEEKEYKAKQDELERLRKKAQNIPLLGENTANDFIKHIVEKYNVPDYSVAWDRMTEDEKNRIDDIQKNFGRYDYAEDTKRVTELQRELSSGPPTGVPSAPFVGSTKNWSLLTIKRMVRYAAENGFDSIAWTPGEVQAERYDLSKQVDFISWNTSGDKRYVTIGGIKGVSDQDIEISVDRKTGKVGTTDFGAEQFRNKDLSDVVGKDIADRILTEEKGNLKEDGLKVGGEGMKGFYDKILPATVNKFFGKDAWGRVKVGTVNIPKPNLWAGSEVDKGDEPLTRGTIEVWTLPITPEMKSKALYEGMPLFSIKSIMEQKIPDDMVVTKNINMGELEKLETPPQWLAKKYPEVKEMFNRMKQRDKDRTRMLSQSIDETADFYAMKKGSEEFGTLNNLIWTLENEKIEGLPNKFKKNDDGSYDLNEEHYTEYRKFLDKMPSLSERIKDNYINIRKSLDKDLTMVYRSMTKMEDIEETVLDQFRRSMGQIHNYFPHVRHGKYYFQAYNFDMVQEGETWTAYIDGAPIASGKDKEAVFNQAEMHDDSEVLYREHFDAVGPYIRKAKRLIEDLKKTGRFQDQEVSFRMDEVTKMPEDVFAIPVPIEAIEAVMNAAIDRIEDQDGKKAFRALLPKAVSDALKSRGWGAHMIKRKGIPGHEINDTQRVLFDYKAGLYGWITKMQTARDFSRMMANVSSSKKPRLWAWMRNYSYNMLENTDEIDRRVSNLKAIFFAKYLGGNIKTSLLNTTQNIIAGWPRLGMEVGLAFGKVLRGANASIVQAVSGKANLNEDEIRLLTEMFDEGTTGSQFLTEVRSQIGDNVFSIGNKYIMRGLGLPMEITERFNRVSMALASYRSAVGGKINNEKTLARYGMKKGEAFSYDQAKEFAEEIVEDTHFVYGKSNRPEIFRGSTAGKYAATGYTFRSFTHHLAHLWKFMFQDSGRGKRAVAKSLAATIAIGGLTSVPLYKTFMNFIRQLTGDDPEEEILNLLPEDANMLRDMVVYGIPSISGFTMGGSIGMELPVFERLRFDEPFMDQLGSNVGEIAGVPWAAAEDIASAIRAYQSGQGSRALEYLAPAGVANIMKSVRLGTKGSYTLTGRPINVPGSEGPQKLNLKEAIGKGFGFQPTKLTKSWNINQALQDFQTYKTSKRSEFATKIANARGDEKKLDKIRNEFIKWNQDNAKDRPEYIITEEELIQSIRARSKTRKPPRYMFGKTKELRDRYFQEAP